MRYLVAVACAGVLVIGASQASTPSSGPTPRSGLYGTVSRGPTTPICVAEQPCSAPAAGVTLEFRSNGHVEGHAVTRKDGTYRIALPAALYTVRATSGRSLDPDTARVRALRFQHINFFIDTGIR
jgi:hypothetical protein